VTKPADKVGRGKRTSYVDRAWYGVWTAVAIGPVKVPDVEILRAEMVGFMAQNPTHPLSCTLSGDRRRWLPVAPADREKHVAAAIVGGDAIDGRPADPYVSIAANRTSGTITTPYKVVVGQESILVYFAHIGGDSTVFSPFSCGLLGDFDQLRPLRPNAGLATILKLFVQQLRPHGRDWWRQLSAKAVGDEAAEPSPQIVNVVPDDVIATGVQIDKATFAAFLAWRKAKCPNISVTALMTTATYLAFAAEGLPIDPSGFNTILDLRRYLPKDQVLRPANLAVGTFIKADISDPVDVAASLVEAVESARAVPEALAGTVFAGVLRRAPAPASTSERVTMTFNSMPRNPGTETIPWLDENEITYTGMTYPGRPDALSIFALGIEGQMEFAASFNPNVLDRTTVRQALTRLNDMPALLESRFGAEKDEARTSLRQQAPSI
jgi:hypothetical protein